MSGGAVERGVGAVLAALAALALGCGPAAVLPSKTDKKKDTLPDDVGSLLSFAESRTFEDAPLQDLSEAAEAYDKAIVMSLTRKVPLSRPEMKWRLARVCFFASEQEKADESKMKWIERGEKAAAAAVLGLPERVEGHYYLGVLKGRRAQYSGKGFSAMLLARKVEDHGLRAAELDPAFEDGGPYRLLAMLYAKAPPWPTSIGDLDEAREYADKAVALSGYPMNHLVRAEVLVEDGEPDEARRELETVLAAERAGRWAHEGEIWIPYARQLLERLEAGE